MLEALPHPPPAQASQAQPRRAASLLPAASATAILAAVVAAAVAVVASGDTAAPAAELLQHYQERHHHQEKQPTTTRGETQERQQRDVVLEPGQTTVVPRFWTGAPALDPALYTVDAGGSLGPDDLLRTSSIAVEMKDKFASVGLVHVTNTGLSDAGDMRTLARIVMGEETEYEGGANPRGRDQELGSVYDVGAPLEASLAYHHEMVYKTDSVETLGFLCKHAVQRGTVGWSFVSDSVQAHDYIMKTPLGKKLREKGLCFVRRMTDAAAENLEDKEKGVIYNHWQQSWMTDDPVEAQKAAEAQGLTVEWEEDPKNGRVMKTRYYKSAFEYVPSLDRNIMVTSIADDGEWFDTWPGIKDVPQEDRPLEMFFGDDEPLTLEEKQLWTDAYDKFGVPLPWKEGDVAVIDNMRFAHGRPGIHLLPGEKRELGVMLGKFYELQEHREDKWAEDVWMSSERA